VLQQLSARRTALDERERNLAMREQLIGITEKRVEERLTELKTLEERLSAMLSARDEAEEKQLIALVKTYENMKPAEAARIFNRLDRQVLVNVASRMKPNKIGPVMAAMEPARAQDLTVMLALRLNVARKPAEAPVVAPQPVALPPNG
jgi:flagellar motility protein MotE (MotC chaperone)